MVHPLDGVQAKLHRSIEHLDALVAEVGIFDVRRPHVDHRAALDLAFLEQPLVELLEAVIAVGEGGRPLALVAEVNQEGLDMLAAQLSESWHAGLGGEGRQQVDRGRLGDLSGAAAILGGQVTEERVAEWTDYHRGGRIGPWAWGFRPWLSASTADRKS